MKTNRPKSITLAVSCLTIFLFAGFASATTYEMPYYSDGADHFYTPPIYLESGGTHSFFVNGVPWGSYNYVAFKDTGSGGAKTGIYLIPKTLSKILLNFGG